MKKLAVIALLLFSGCSNSGSGNSNSIAAPTPGQWVNFGASEPSINQGAHPSWPIPCCDGSTVAGYFYTNLGLIPKTGQTLTLNYSLTGNGPVFQNASSGGDSGAPTIHLFIWERGDNISCQGDYNYYRLFAARTPLVLGTNQIVSVPLVGASWQGCYPPPPALTDVRMQITMNNALGFGVVFGGQNFAGHGIYLSSGNATFTINSFTVQ